MSTKTILIAEDEKIVSLDLKMLLQNNNYIVSSSVSTGEDLILQNKLKRPDLIIADLGLKGKVSGIDAIKEIRKLDNTPIIIISGSLKSKLKKLAGTISNMEILTKPFEQSELLYLANKFFSNQQILSK
jgi:two-component system, response regulator PdtaR